MSYIAGLCSIRGGAVRAEHVKRMADAQGRLAPDGSRFVFSEEAAFARGVYRRTPEDAFDVLPLEDRGRFSVLAADARIDNREVILRRLSLPLESQLSDAELACRLLALEGECAFNHLQGDYAVAAWDSGKRTLTLVRDITGQRPLHYHVADGVVAFATMPHGLLAMMTGPVRTDLAQLARFVADIPRSGDATFFEGLARVEPGHLVRIGPDGIVSRRYWNPELAPRPKSSDSDYVVALRERLEEATRARLRGHRGAVAAQLSAGLDSGAVAASAAREIKSRGGEVVAFTSAPSIGFTGPVPRGRVADESGFAAAVVAMHPNMRSVIVRADGQSPLDVIRRDAALFGEPMGLPCNQVWWSAIAAAAQEAGLEVLLTGEAGNYAFSSGGVDTLHDYLREWQLLSVVRESIALRARGVTWLGAAYGATGPWIPKIIWKLLQQLRWGNSTTSEGLRLLSGRAQSQLPEQLQAVSRSGRPEGGRGRRLELLSQGDPGAFRKGMLARWGVDERDPMADRSLIEFCLTLPPEQLLRGGVTRRLARLALSDRLPGCVLDGPRGYQGADWYQRVSPAHLEEVLAEAGMSPRVRELLDLDGMIQLARAWPREDWASGSVISRFRYALLRALSAAAFVQSFEDGEGRAALRHCGTGTKPLLN